MNTLLNNTQTPEQQLSAKEQTALIEIDKNVAHLRNTIAIANALMEKLATGHQYSVDTQIAVQEDLRDGTAIVPHIHLDIAVKM